MGIEWLGNPHHHQLANKMAAILFLHEIMMMTIEETEEERKPKTQNNKMESK